MPQVVLDAGVIGVCVWHFQIGVDRARIDRTRVVHYAAEFARSKNRWKTWVNACRLCRERGRIEAHARGARVGPVVRHGPARGCGCKSDRDAVKAVIVAPIADMDGPVPLAGRVKCEADSRRDVAQRRDRHPWYSLLRKPKPAGQDVWTS